MASIARKRRTYEKHGMTHTPEYRIWASMIQRCGNQNNTKYNVYGARGITVCDRWKNSFLDFYNDVGKRPDSSLSLDRIKGNIGYQPGNVKWSTINEQNVNKRPWKDNPLGYKGVHRSPAKHIVRYVATISKGDGTLLYIGSYNTREEAAYMYDCFALSIHGDNAILNFDYI